MVEQLGKWSTKRPIICCLELRKSDVNEEHS